MRGVATTLIVLTVPVMLALPALGHAQAPTITRGVLGGSLSPDSSSGVLRGTLPQGATTGVVRGTLPPGGTAGLLQATPPGATVGVFRDTAAAARVPVMPGESAQRPCPCSWDPFRRMRASAALAAPLPPGTRLGAPGPGEIMQGLDFQARIYLEDGNYAHGEKMLNGSVAIREDMVGRVTRRSPEPSRPTPSCCATTAGTRRPPTWKSAPRRSARSWSRRRRPGNPIASDPSRVRAVPGRS